MTVAETSMDALAWREKASGDRTSNETSYELKVLVLIQSRVGAMLRKA